MCSRKPIASDLVEVEAADVGLPEESSDASQQRSLSVAAWSAQQYRLMRVGRGYHQQGQKLPNNPRRIDIGWQDGGQKSIPGHAGSTRIIVYRQLYCRQIARSMRVEHAGVDVQQPV